MPIITIVITLIIVGVLLWLANTYIPMDGKIKKILNIVVVVLVVLWLLNVFGIWGRLGSVRMSIQTPALAEARGNTLEAALLKATWDLEHQVQARQLRRLERGKSQLQLSAISGRWTHTQAARGAQ